MGIDVAGRWRLARAGLVDYCQNHGWRQVLFVGRKASRAKNMVRLAAREKWRNVVKVPRSIEGAHPVA